MLRILGLSAEPLVRARELGREIARVSTGGAGACGPRALARLCTFYRAIYHVQGGQICIH